MNSTSQNRDGRWLFLSNHLHVLACLSREPESTIREVSDRVGITERAVLQIVRDLERDGYLSRERVGRRNHYLLHLRQPLRHPLHAHRSLSELLDFLRHGAA